MHRLMLFGGAIESACYALVQYVGCEIAILRDTTGVATKHGLSTRSDFVMDMIMLCNQKGGGLGNRAKEIN